jgi:pimeloyl-ACP methyl ester carboxylesterase
MRVSIGEVSLFFEVFGREWVLDGDELRRRRALVGLHGGPGFDGTKLRHSLEPLADAAQVVVPDQRGHGRSDRDEPGKWNLETWARDVKAFCDALEVEQPIVFGASFGGFVAQKYAATYPDHPRALILASTCARVPSTDELVERFRELGGDEAADITRRDLEDPSEETLAEWERVCGRFYSRNPNPDPGIARAVAAAIRDPEVTVHFMSHEGKSLDLRGELARITCPTLVLAGAHDPLLPGHLREELADAIPNARLEVIEEASHDIFADDPDHTYRCLREFLGELAP